MRACTGTDRTVLLSRKITSARRRLPCVTATGAGAISSATSAGTCVIVGGGIGGLVTAAKLAQSGMHVTICEKNSSMGGRCQSLEIDGCRFDTGPSLLLLPQTYKETFSWLGSDISEWLQLKRVEPAAYRVWFADGHSSSQCSTSLDLFYDVQQMVAQLEQEEAGAGESRHADVIKTSSLHDVNQQGSQVTPRCGHSCRPHS